MEENRRKQLLWTGLIGSGLMALCCVTPILVLLLGVINCTGGHLATRDRDGRQTRRGMTAWHGNGHAPSFTCRRLT
jgi:fumarate reductase subunit D